MIWLQLVVIPSMLGQKPRRISQNSGQSLQKFVQREEGFKTELFVKGSEVGLFLRLATVIGSVKGRVLNICI